MNIPVATHDQVYLYVQSLPLPEDTLSFMTTLLNAEEQQRAARYHFERDRQRFIAARGLLRYVLSHYLAISANDIVFHYGPQGKPHVADSSIQFNVSHSDDRILIGIGHYHPLGVDVEHMTRQIEVAEIAARFFTLNESKQILALQGEAQRRAFFNVWTRKEALLKAIGSGLSMSLQGCEVSASDDAISTVLACDAPSFDIHDWQVHRRSVEDEYLAAAVVRAGMKVEWIILNHNS